MCACPGLLKRATRSSNSAPIRFGNDTGLVPGTCRAGRDQAPNMSEVNSAIHGLYRRKVTLACGSCRKRRVSERPNLSAHAPEPRHDSEVNLGMGQR